MLCAQNQVDPLDMGHLFRFELRVTAGHNNKGSRMLFADATDGLATFLIGQFRYRAGVYDTDVCFFTRTGFTYALLCQYLPDGGGLCEVELTAQGIISSYFIFKYGFVYHCD